jgi:hypothetical protein
MRFYVYIVHVQRGECNDFECESYSSFSVPSSLANYFMTYNTFAKSNLSLK